jgi:DNA mismatch endonuclease (patch repair protein)
MNRMTTWPVERFALIAARLGGRCYKEAMDHVDATTRSAIMRAVRPKGSGPEMLLRRMLHGLGYRYALHRADLPGTPDLVFPARKKILFVHGCFWHRHGCRYTTDPKTREDFWQAKFTANVTRDKKTLVALRHAGWRCLVVWQCQLKQPEKTLNRVQKFLEAA